jgi:Fur family ferric uptake transcriptional regulator
MNEQTTELLEAKKIRITPIRILILETFLNSDSAISQYDIEKELPWTDNVSIFRTLKTFEKQSLIHLINDGSQPKKYALCSVDCKINKHKIHPHFHCEKCNKTTCLSEQNIHIESIPKDFIVIEYDLIIKGLCPDCINAIELH